MHQKSRGEIFRLINQKHLQWEKCQVLLADIIQRADDATFVIDLSDFDDPINYHETLIADLVKAYVISEPTLAAERINRMGTLYSRTVAQQKSGFTLRALGIVLGNFEAIHFLFQNDCLQNNGQPMQEKFGYWLGNLFSKCGVLALEERSLKRNNYLARIDAAVKGTIGFINPGVLLGALQTLEAQQTNKTHKLISAVVWDICYTLLGKTTEDNRLKTAITLVKLHM